MKKLDLHETKHEDVQRKVIRFIEDNWGSGEVEIITGYSEKMQTLVAQILDEYKLSYSVGRKYDLHNRGYIAVLLE